MIEPQPPIIDFATAIWVAFTLVGVLGLKAVIRRMIDDV